MENGFIDIPVIIQPREISTKLYQHQLASVYDMEKREEQKFIMNGDMHIETNIGVNADKTGYGKTLSMVTMIFRDNMDWNMSIPYSLTQTKTLAGGRIKKTNTTYYNKIDTTIVLASQSIIHQWYEELEKTPLAIKMITSRKIIETTLIDNYDVVLVTPSMYNGLVSKYYGFAWKRFIFDEPGHIKVPGMRKIVAGFNWFITATPDSIISKHKNCRNSFIRELIQDAGWNSFSQYFSYLIVKNEDSFINFSFSMPIPIHNYYKCYNPMYKAVRGFVGNRISEMISAGNISGAIKALGGGNTQNIVELVKKKKLDEIDEITSRIRILFIRNKKNQIEFLEKRIKHIELQIKELGSRYEEILSGNCNICFERIRNPVMETKCQNIFCGKCLLKWLENKNTCPLCRCDIDKKNLTYIGDSHSFTSQIEEKKPQTKIDTIVRIIKENPNGKFIIFSSWDETFTPICNILIKNNIKFIEVNGTVNTRKKNIYEYKSGKINVIFLNSRFNGAGINLQETTDIIVYHEMTDNTLNQIIGRANRLGRIKQVNVHHLQI